MHILLTVSSGGDFGVRYAVRPGVHKPYIRIICANSLGALYIRSGLLRGIHFIKTVRIMRVLCDQHGSVVTGRVSLH